MFKTLDKYLIYIFFKKILITFSIFFALIFILSLLEEIEFFQEFKSGLYLSILASLLNSPSLLLEIIPFIIFISCQFFFIDIINSKEIEIIKIKGVKNFYFIKILTLSSIILSIIILIAFHPLSSKFKFLYLELKNSYSKDGKYLAIQNSNGLWLKDEINEESFIINATNKKEQFLYNVIITKFDKNNNLLEIISSEKVDISNKEWNIFEPKITSDNSKIKFLDFLKFKTHFDYKKIETSFNELNSLNFFQLIRLKDENVKIGYSTDEIELYLIKNISLPLYISILVILSSVIMLNTKRNKTLIFHILTGILMSVIIYYINNMFGVLSLTQKITLSQSIIYPLVILTIIIMIGLVKINEK